MDLAKQKRSANFAGVMVKAYYEVGQVLPRGRAFEKGIRCKSETVPTAVTSV